MVVDAFNASAEVTFNSNSSSPACCGLSSGSDVAGVVSPLEGKVDVRIRVSGSSSAVEIVLAGPADVWFGVGFGAVVMAARPYAIVVDGTGAVTERMLGQHEAGTLLRATLKVLSSEVAGGVRTLQPLIFE